MKNIYLLFLLTFLSVNTYGQGKIYNRVIHDLIEKERISQSDSAYIMVIDSTIHIKNKILLTKFPNIDSTWKSKPLFIILKPTCIKNKITIWINQCNLSPNIKEKEYTITSYGSIMLQYKRFKNHLKLVKYKNTGI